MAFGPPEQNRVPPAVLAHMLQDSLRELDVGPLPPDTRLPPIPAGVEALTVSWSRAVGFSGALPPALCVLNAEFCDWRALPVELPASLRELRLRANGLSDSEALADALRRLTALEVLEIGATGYDCRFLPPSLRELGFDDNAGIEPPALPPRLG